MQIALFKTFFDNAIQYYAVPDNISCEKNAYYLLQTKLGEDVALCITHNLEDKNLHPICRDDSPEKKPLYVVQKLDTESVKKHFDNQKNHATLLKKANQEKNKLHLDIHILRIYFTYQKQKVICSFMSKERVDFRELVKSLFSIFQTRVEMRQIGSRDVTKLINGFGVCGREFCCSNHSSCTKNVTLKHAKEHNLGNNASNLIGVCGKLKCCLTYEENLTQTKAKSVNLNKLK